MPATSLWPIESDPYAEVWEQAVGMATGSGNEHADDLWHPHPGPQTRFLAAVEFEVLYGGAAGGGKSDALLFCSLKQVDKPGYRALILRHTYPELAELMDRAHGYFGKMGASWNEQKKRWTFPSGAVVEFGYCVTWRDVQRYQGQQFSYIGFDEIGNLAEERIWLFLMSRCRSGGSGITPLMRASANPGGPGHAWLKRRFIETCGAQGEKIHTEPLTGLTRRFVPARLRDNPTLTDNNPQYEAQLLALPDMLRRQLLDGDWDAGMGMALGELSRDVHIIPAFEPPAHWTRFGAFDWGFAHPWSFGYYVQDEESNIYKIDTVTGRNMLPHEIHDRVASRVPLDTLKAIDAGHDLWNEIRARGENTPTLYEQFRALGWKRIDRANISRASGLNNMRRYIHHDAATQPRFLLMDTPGNQHCFDVLQSMVSDPADPEDALKLNADPYTGEGGDDPYDETRYGLASRPYKTQPLKVVKKPARNVDTGLEKLLARAQEAQDQRNGKAKGLARMPRTEGRR